MNDELDTVISKKKRIHYSADVAFDDSGLAYCTTLCSATLYDCEIVANTVDTNCPKCAYLKDKPKEYWPYHN